MDFDNDDIGNFGLPPLNTNTGATKPSRLPRSKKARGAKTSISKKCAHKKTNDMNHPRRRINGTKKSCTGRTMENNSNDGDSSDSSSDDDEIALSDLAKVAPKMTDVGKQSGRHAVVTPASFFTNKQPPQQQSRSKTSRKEGCSNDKSTTGEGQHRKKLKKQIGLHSFLQEKRQTKITTQVPSSKPAVNELLSLNNEGNGNHDMGFVSAASLLSGNDTRVAGEDASSVMQDQPNGQEDVSASKVVTAPNDPAVDDIDEFDDDTDEHANVNSSRTMEEKSSSSNINHPQRFGIHSLILGHGLPIMHPDEYYRAASTTATASASSTSVDTDANSQEGSGRPQTNSHVNRNILSHILQRTYCPKPSTPSSNLLTQYVHSNTNEHSTETVQLSASSNNNNNSETCAMAFDTMGVLLAMGDNRGKIDIFDFDEVYSADLNKRNEWSRHCYEYQVAAAASVGRDGDDDENCISSTHIDGDIVAEKEGAEKEEEEEGNDTVAPPLPPSKVNPVHSFQCQFIHGNATRNNNYLNSANRPRISGIHWNPDNQDHLAVSFENKSEIHLYDVASSTMPPPCLRVGESFSSRGGHGIGTQQQRCEGVLSMRFIPSAIKGDSKSSLSGRSGSTQIITGGAYGLVRLWSIPSTKQVGIRRRRCCISEVNAKCMWSIPVFGSSGDGVSDMLILPIMTPLHTSRTATTASTKATSPKPLVLLSGGSSSTLVLLDTNKCTRKAFSTSITPTVAASWKLHQLASRELAKIDAKAHLPDRRWMSARNMKLIEYRRLTEAGESWWCKIGLVTNAGWVFVAELSCNNNTPRLSIRIVHHTPRIQCFNSSKERLTILGGMALKYSLPNAPVPSSDCIRMTSSNMIWLADVKGKKYTMPSKDKYVLSEYYNTLEYLGSDIYSGSDVYGSDVAESSSKSGMILVSLDTMNLHADGSPTSRNIVTRLSLPMNGGAPLAMETHPSGEWMVVGCGKGDSTLLKLIRLRKKM